MASTTFSGKFINTEIEPMKFVFKSKIPALVDAGIYFFKFL